MWRIVFIFLLMIMSGVNVLLDYLRHASIYEVDATIIFMTLVAAVAAGLPAAALLFISVLSKFRIAGVNICRLASDLVLSMGLAIWFYLLFIRERPEYYEGASHMYVAFIPALIGFFAIGLFLLCLLVQGTLWAVKHKNRGQ